MTEVFSHEIIINANCSETRIALIENGRLAEIFIERHNARKILGNIYHARVTRVVPGMQAAFLDIGIGKAAFLFGGDIVDKEYIASVQYDSDLVSDQGVDDDIRQKRVINKKSIEDMIKVGDQFPVQIVKEALGNKGPRVTTVLAFPGRQLVLTPDIDMVGVSRRIKDDIRKQELKDQASRIKPPKMGLIVRTAAESATAQELADDLRGLLDVYHQFQVRLSQYQAPAILFQEHSLIMKTMRDLLSSHVTKIVVDDSHVFEELKTSLALMPSFNSQLELYSDLLPIFDFYDIELDIEKTLSRKVWLPSGGYIVIDQTEALTSFDVNSGKFIGKKSIAENILKVNLEAVEEVAVQLRRRNIGGIIIIDFIDMESYADRENLNEALLKALASDKARTNVLSMNELGLVQMTRKRTAESIGRSLTTTCLVCQGNGRVKTLHTLALDLYREVARKVARNSCRRVQIVLRRDLQALLQSDERRLVDSIQTRYGVTLKFEVRDDFTSDAKPDFQIASLD